MNFYEVYRGGSPFAFYLAPTTTRAVVLCAKDERGDAQELSALLAADEDSPALRAAAERRQWLEGRLDVVFDEVRR